MHLLAPVFCVNSDKKHCQKCIKELGNIQTWDLLV